MNYSTTEAPSNGTEVVRGRSDTWTSWFNVDRPWNDGGDHETVDKILHIYGKICEEKYEVVSAQCRWLGADSFVFDKDTPMNNNNSDAFERYCTTEGLICKNSAQAPSGNVCRDYSIRFLCHYNGDNRSASNIFTQFDFRMYIVLALVPILLFLARVLWVYVHRRRQEAQQQRRRLEDRANREGLVNDSFADGLAKPPPAYQDLFGKSNSFASGSSVFAISRENMQVCSSCHSLPCSVALIVGKQSPQSQRSDVYTKLELGEAKGDSLRASSSELCTSEGRSATTKDGGTKESGIPQMAPGKCLVSTQAGNVCDETGFTKNSVSLNTTPGTSFHISHSQNQRFEGLPPQSTITEEFDSETLSEGNKRQCILKLSALSSTSSLMHSSRISQPCPCTCHRTVPLKSKRALDCDIVRSTAEVNDGQSSEHSSYIDIDNLVTNKQEVWCDMSSVTSASVSELPTYEDALELMKKTEAEAKQNSNQGFTFESED